MHLAIATKQTPPPSPSPPSNPKQTLEEITQLLVHLLPSTLSITCFTCRWQILRSKVAALKSLLSEISDSPHWSENSLLTTLLPNLLSTLHRVQTLCRQCSDPSYTPGKLLMQSDLDMATGWLSKQTHDLDLLLRSGVLRQSTAIVLSHPSPNASKEVLSIFIRDIFTRLQIGGNEFRKKAMDSLIQLLSDDEKSAIVVASKGNIGCLVNLIDVTVNPFIREQAITAVSILASASDQSRKSVFEEGALGPLLRIIESSSMPAREKAAMAVECITSDVDNVWAISAYAGLPILIDLCKSGSSVAQSHAVGAIKNVSTAEDVRFALAEEGAIPVLVELLVSGNASAQEKAANCIAILASSGEYFRNLLIQENGLERLFHCLNEPVSSDTLEHVLRAMNSLSVSDLAFKLLSTSSTFIIRIAELVKHGNIMLQQISATLLAKLTMGEGNKRTIGGCMSSLVKLMESEKPDGLQEVAANALVSLLAVRSNRKDLVKDERSMVRLAKMLDPGNDLVSKKFPVAVVAAIMAGGSQSCRKQLVTAGVYGNLQRLAEMEVAGAKKALQRFSGNRITNIFTRTWRE